MKRALSLVAVLSLAGTGCEILFPSSWSYDGGAGTVRDVVDTGVTLDATPADLGTLDVLAVDMAIIDTGAPVDVGPNDTGTSAQTLGGACSLPPGCPSVEGSPGECAVVQDGWPGGYCTSRAECGGMASIGRPCRTNGICGQGVVNSSSTIYCLRRCATDGDCRRPEYACRPVGKTGTGACVPARCPSGTGTCCPCP